MEKSKGSKMVGKVNCDIQDPDHVIVSSGIFEIPIDKDGSLSLASIRAQLPGVSGLWFLSNDGKRKKAVRYDKKTNKLLPPDGHWTNRTYNVSYSSTSGFMDEKELERYEIASRLFQQSIESVSQLTKLDSQAGVRKPRSANLPPVSILLDKGKPMDQNSSIRPGILKQSQSSISHAKSENQLQKIFDSDEEPQIANIKFQTLIGTALADRDSKILELQKRCKEQESVIMEKCKEIENLNLILEQKEQEFELLTVPIEGFGDTKVAQEFNSIKKQLNDAKWRCGELDSALASKAREASALHDWKREAEGTINRLQTDHESCNMKQEKLEATVHALHQFALIMKKEAELAKERAGIDPSLKLYLDEDKILMDEKVEDKVRRFEKDLDVARDNLYRQAEEIEQYKWRCDELETTLSARDKELKSMIKEACNKEKMLWNEINTLKSPVTGSTTGPHAASDRETQIGPDVSYHKVPLHSTYNMPHTQEESKPLEILPNVGAILDSQSIRITEKDSNQFMMSASNASVASISSTYENSKQQQQHLERMPSCTSTSAEEFDIILRNRTSDATDTSTTSPPGWSAGVESYDTGAAQQHGDSDSDFDKAKD